MSGLRRIVAVIVIVVAVMTASTVFGAFQVAKWNENARKGSTTGWASPESFAPLFSPGERWIICIEGASGFQEQAEHWMSQRLSAMSDSGSDSIRFVSAVPWDADGANVLHVKVIPSSLWTPFYATYDDRVEIRYSNRTLAGWPESETAIGTLSLGELRVSGRVTESGKGFGLISRPYLAEHRARVLADHVRSLIADAYEGVEKAPD